MGRRAFVIKVVCAALGVLTFGLLRFRRKKVRTVYVDRGWNYVAYDKRMAEWAKRQLQGCPKHSR